MVNFCYYIYKIFILSFVVSIQQWVLTDDLIVLVMNVLKGLTDKEIKYFGNFDWDDSDAEEEGTSSCFHGKLVSSENTGVLVAEEGGISLEECEIIGILEETEVLVKQLSLCILNNKVTSNFSEQITETYPTNPNQATEGESNSAVSSAERENDSTGQRFPSKIAVNNLKWRQRRFIPGDTSWKCSIDDTVSPPETPFEYFKLFFDDEMFTRMVEQTNLYAMQTDCCNLNVSTKEMEQFVGILIYMGVIKVPEMRMLWSEDLRFSIVTSAMSRNRFEKIKSYLHINDNSTQKEKNDPNYDKLHKVRPLLDGLRKNCLKIPPEEKQAIDEQVIPFKGTSCLKQYNPKKPHKWGFKVFTRAGVSGFVYDFAPYVGEGTCKNYGLGISSDIVLHLTRELPDGCGFKVYFDNWFASVAVAVALKERDIFCVGTIKSNRLGKKCQMKCEKELKKIGRGSFDYRVEVEHDFILVRWFDNKTVQLISTHCGVDPVGKCSRWNNKKKQHVEIDQPYIVKEYNSFMGGVDLADMLAELYRIDHKSRKYYTRITYWCINTAIVNSWILYRRHCQQALKKEKEVMSLLTFQCQIAKALLYVNVSNSRKRGRPNLTTLNTLPQETPPSKVHIKCPDVQYDNIGH